MTIQRPKILHINYSTTFQLHKIIDSSMLIADVTKHVANDDIVNIDTLLDLVLYSNKLSEQIQMLLKMMRVKVVTKYEIEQDNSNDER